MSPSGLVLVLATEQVEGEEEGDRRQAGRLCGAVRVLLCGSPAGEEVRAIGWLGVVLGGRLK